MKVGLAESNLVDPARKINPNPEYLKFINTNGWQTEKQELPPHITLLAQGSTFSF